jgi:uncharacterized membrane protein
MSIFSVFGLCLVTFVFGVNLSAYAFVPEKYPLNWWEISGWLAMAAAIICWEVGKK